MTTVRGHRMGRRRPSTGTPLSGRVAPTSRSGRALAAGGLRAFGSDRGFVRTTPPRRPKPRCARFRAVGGWT